MATILKKDEEAQKKEVQVKEKSSQENEKRLEYLQNLKKDPLFRRFVIEEIFDKEMEQLTDIRAIPLDGKPEEVVSILATAKAARTKLEVIRSKLV